MKKHGGDMNVEELDGKTLTPDQFLSDITTMPFLGEKRFVMVKNLLLEGENDVQKTISKHLDACPDFCVAVFVEEGLPDQRTVLFKKLQKCGKVEEFKLKIGASLLAQIFKICKKLGVEIQEEAAIFLSELVGGDLYRMENELQKLAHYALSRSITRADIDLLVDTKLDTSIFRLTDALGNGDQKQSLHLLHQLLDSGEDLHRTLFMIIRQFRIIAQVKDLIHQGLRKAAIAEKIGEHPYVCGIAMSQANNFALEKLREIYQSLLKIEIKLKTGGIKILTGDNREFVLAVDKFIVDTCSLRIKI